MYPFNPSAKGEYKTINKIIYWKKKKLSFKLKRFYKLQLKITNKQKHMFIPNEVYW